MKKNSGSSLQKLARAPVLAGILGVLLILSAIALSTNHFLAFFSLEGLIIVVGGVLAVAFMSFHESDVRAALRAIRGTFGETTDACADLPRDISHIISWARIAREKGMRGLEATIGKNGLNDPFINYGLTMVVSDYTPEEIRAMMETAADAHYERDSMPAQVLQAMASHAPAFGMVGTLIGMVTMLYSLNDNTANLGSALAVSFLSTLYGVITARMVYMPAAARLSQKLENLRFRNHLIAEGMVMLVSNKAPIYIQDRLSSFLRPEMSGNLSMPPAAHHIKQLQVSNS